MKMFSFSSTESLILMQENKNDVTGLHYYNFTPVISLPLDLNLKSVSLIDCSRLYEIM